MKAVVFHGVGDIRLEEVPEPEIEEDTDAIVRITTAAICGTDLHMVRGTLSGMEEGTILGHEGVGVIERLGPAVRNFVVGDRVLIPSTIACGSCSYCRAGYTSQCDIANPNGNRAGTAFFGGPASTGPFNGLQAEKARVPFANVGLIKLPDDVSDEEAILLSDIFPTGYFAAELAEVTPGDSVAVFGCGPVGQFAIASAKLLGAGRIFAVDRLEDRLEMARRQGAEIVNFDKEDPVETIVELTQGIGVDRAIDAVGVDAEAAHAGPAQVNELAEDEFKEELSKVAPEQNADGDLWVPGNAPSQVVRWAVDALAKAGTLAMVGVYPPSMDAFPVGEAMNKNLTLKMGNCPHRTLIPKLLELVRSGVVEPTQVLTEVAAFHDSIEAYEAFDRREKGWLKVALEPAA
jgi:threonine dehydrogenase-like Zn-dependent dehydrogenase